MGQVRAIADLANVVDGALCVAGQLPENRVRPYRADAMVDTGAVGTVIPQYAADQLGLVVMGRREVTYAYGATETANVVAPFPIEIVGRDAFEEALVGEKEVLIGQTGLEKTDLGVAG